MRYQPAVYAAWHAYLEHMLEVERVCKLSPLAHQILVPFTHHEREILICLPLDNTIVLDTLLTPHHRTPSVAMKDLEEGRRRAMKA